MGFVPTEEQQILKQAVADFVQAQEPLRRIRALRDDADSDGFSREVWREMAGLGWAGILIPEIHGGSGLGFTETMIVMEELGRGLVPEPMLSTVLVGASALLVAGHDAQQKELLPAVASGECLLALAYQEPESRFDPHHVAVRAEPSNGGWKLTGTKHLALDGHAADRILVSARTSGETVDPDGITLFWIDPSARGVTRTKQHLVDHRCAAIVELENVSVTEDNVLGKVDRGGEILETVLDRGAAALSAEMLGSMTAAFDMTLEHLKTRKQFGQPIGSFQALKHRAAQMFVETELARSAVMAAHRALDEQRPNASAMVSVAKAKATDTFLLVAGEAVQMHGGIGMTDEHDIGFYLKRARAAEMTFGDAPWHRERYAHLSGY